MIWTLCGILVFSGLVYLLMLRKFKEQERVLQGYLAQMAAGNVLPFSIAPKGTLGKSCENLRQKIAMSARWLTAANSSLDAVQVEFTDIAEHTLRGTEQITQGNRVLAACGDQANRSTQQIAGTSQQFSDQISTMSAALEELSITIQDVSSHVVKVAALGKDASQSAAESKRVVADLSEMAQGIVMVVDLIRQLASQTNLLALNATIEAATAGEAGKGFAVVASEVKELARQSGASAGQIDEKIRNILARISDVASRVGHLQDSVQAISEASQNIAATTEEQSVTAKSLAAEISSMNQAGQNLTTQIHSNTEAMGNIALQGKNIECNCSELSSITHERNQKGLSRLNLLKQTIQFLANSFSSKELFDIAAIKAGHMAWYKQLQALVSGTGQLKSSEVTDHQSCGLGKWYFGPESSPLRSKPVFQELGRHHEIVHQSARQVALAMEQQKYPEAKTHLQHFEEARIKLFACLDSLYVEN